MPSIHDQPLRGHPTRPSEVMASGSRQRGGQQDAPNRPSNQHSIEAAASETRESSCLQNSSILRRTTVDPTPHTKFSPNMPVPGDPVSKCTPADGAIPFNTADPQGVFQGLGAVYCSVTPDYTPSLSMDSASSEPNSDVSEGVALNLVRPLGWQHAQGPTISVQAMEFDWWQPFDGDGYDMVDADNTASIEDQLLAEFSGWDDVNMDFKLFTVDTSHFFFDIADVFDEDTDFDKPFTIDMSQYDLSSSEMAAKSPAAPTPIHKNQAELQRASSDSLVSSEPNTCGTKTPGSDTIDEGPPNQYCLLSETEISAVQNHNGCTKNYSLDIHSQAPPRRKLLPNNGSRPSRFPLPEDLKTVQEHHHCPGHISEHEQNQPSSEPSLCLASPQSSSSRSASVTEYESTCSSEYEYEFYGTDQGILGGLTSQLLKTLTEVFFSSAATWASNTRDEPAGDEQRENSRYSDSCQTGDETSDQSSHTTNPGKRKRQNSMDKQPGDGDGEDSRPPKIAHISPQNKPQILLWACPFSKWKPLSYQGCYKYLMKDISRVKQHLARTHEKPFHCPTCWEIFRDEDRFYGHIQERACATKPGTVLDGITTAQKKLLERRADKRLSKSEQWYAIFSILFPDQPHPKSPYVESNLSAELLSFQAFMSKDGLQIVEETARSHIPQELLPRREEVVAFSQTLFQQAIPIILERYESTRPNNNSPDSGYASVSSTSTSLPAKSKHGAGTVSGGTQPFSGEKDYVSPGVHVCPAAETQSLPPDNIGNLADETLLDSLSLPETFPLAQTPWDWAGAGDLGTLESSLSLGEFDLFSTDQVSSSDGQE